MIRCGLESDLPRAVELLRDSHAAADFPFPFHADYAGTLFLGHLGRTDRLALVLEVEGRAQGLLLAHRGQHWFGPFSIASETVWWIDPDHRGASAVKMLAAYEAWARDHGCAYVGMAAKGNDPRPAKLYLRRGYALTETHYWRVV